jgi:hypothetical protein
VSSIAGLPFVVLASGTTADGLPIAIEFMGRPFSEAILLRIAAAYERRRGPRPLPRYRGDESATEHTLKGARVRTADGGEASGSSRGDGPESAALPRVSQSRDVSVGTRTLPLRCFAFQL